MAEFLLTENFVETDILFGGEFNLDSIIIQHSSMYQQTGSQHMMDSVRLKPKINQMKNLYSKLIDRSIVKYLSTKGQYETLRNSLKYT